MFNKIMSIFFTLLLTSTCVEARSITNTIKTLNINPGAVSVSVKNVKDGSQVYSLNENIPRNPASTLKLVTVASSLDTLGTDYNFSTELYKSTNNDLYLKLGADPFFKSSDLSFLLEAAKAKNITEPKNIYFDDSIFDNIEWGEGWQWDDELNPLMPKYSSYNLDGNVVSLDFNISNGISNISIRPFYPYAVMNLLDIDSSSPNNLVIQKNNDFANNVIIAYGNLIKSESIIVPVQSPKIYFRMRFDELLNKQKIEYGKSYFNKKTPDKNVYLVEKVEHDIIPAVVEILKNSNNMYAETVFKLAGAKYSDNRGSLENSLSMLNSYLNKLGIKSDDILIVDGSGVSKNNLMTADFMTSFLVKNYNNSELVSKMPIPGEGTLKNRMLYFKGNLRAKTGTLSNTSSIAGYITTRKGNIYAFDIMINDAKTSSSDKKNIEEQILREIYMN